MAIVGRSENLRLKSEEDTLLIASRVANALVAHLPQDVSLNCWLEGDLGAGKTTFTRYLLRTLGHQGKVKSPTYNLCEPYSLSYLGKSIDIHHFDLYRMNHPREWEEAGFRDIFISSGICIIEWPEIAEGTLPPADLQIHLEVNPDDSRTLYIEALSELGLEILNDIIQHE